MNGGAIHFDSTEWLQGLPGMPPLDAQGKAVDPAPIRKPTPRPLPSARVPGQLSVKPSPEPEATPTPEPVNPAPTPAVKKTQVRKPRKTSAHTSLKRASTSPIIRRECGGYIYGKWSCDQNFVAVVVRNRVAKGMTLKALAAQTGVAPDFIREILRAERVPADLTTGPVAARLKAERGYVR